MLALWPFTPNWEQPVTETLAWLTDVQRSSTGAELRRALRLAPRRSFAAQVLAAGPERTLFDLWVHTRASSPLALPIWPDMQLLGADLLPGSMAVACRTVGFDFVAGGQAALLGESALDGELVTVDTVTPEGLTLGGPVIRTWPASTRLYPVRQARLAELPEVTRKTDALLTAEVRFSVQEPCDWPAAVPAPLYRSAPVFAQRPDESQDLTRGFERLTELLDNDTGIPHLTDTAGRGFTLQQHRWALHGRSEQAALRGLLYHLRGQQRACWLPTHAADLLPLASSANTLTVARCGYAAHAPLAPGRRDVRLELLDGSSLHRRITAAAQVGDTEVLALDGPAPAASNIARASFMALARLAGDEVQIDHITDADGLARVATTWRSLRDELEATP